jgi:hypothetical protein
MSTDGVMLRGMQEKLVEHGEKQRTLSRKV